MSNQPTPKMPVPTFRRKSKKSFKDLGFLGIDEKDKLMCEERIKYSNAVKQLYLTYHKYKAQRFIRHQANDSSKCIANMTTAVKSLKDSISDDTLHLKQLDIIIKESNAVLHKEIVANNNMG